MTINNIFKSLLSAKNSKSCYQWEVDTEGLNFFVNPAITKKIEQGTADLWVTQQHIALSMLVEQENAEKIPHGFIVPSNIVVQLDSITHKILDLPPLWSNSIHAEIKGNTAKSNFIIYLKIQTNNNLTSSFELKGPILQLSYSQKYLLTPEQYQIFDAIEKHKLSKKSEYDNLKLVFSLQAAKKSGARINLAHFEKLDIKTPDSISIKVEQSDNGNLILTPYMGQDASHEKIQQVLGQLQAEQRKALRVGNEIILFDYKKLKAVHEILKNRIVPTDKVKEFLKSPTLFIDASFVDLDIGFSVRVHGATAFKHAYFGETDESSTDWFGKKENATPIFPITKLPSYINTTDDLINFKKLLTDACKVNAETLEFVKKYFDISNLPLVSDILKEIEGSLKNGKGADNKNDNEKPENELELENEKAVVNIELNDEDVNSASPALEESIEKVLYPFEELNWSNYSRKPFPHQKTGIQWILGLVLAKEKFEGGLLADDMGLGKTLMALSAVDQLYKINNKSKKTNKPCLVVAPLSLLQNWKDEVDKTFSTSPFDDIIILQSDADLPKYRVGGIETNQKQIDEESTAEIRYSLKVGASFLADRLDLPKRLVITTYQTLRDYQFSLCTIDWGMVIFDEAQNIKNPNTLQTRAAKGLKADFKLLATGTPVENSLADFWCLMDTAHPAYLGSYQSFRQSYIAPITQAAGDEVEDIRRRVGRELRLKVGALMLRRVKEDNLEGLPQKHIFVGVENQEWKYLSSLKSMMKNTQLDIYDATINAQNIDNESNMVLTALQRLRDVSLHPQLADRGMLQPPKENKEISLLMNESGKIHSVLEILDLIRKKDEKCIIFVVNKRLQAFLSLALSRLYHLGHVSIINGDVKAVAKKKSTPTRKTIIEDFENRDGFNIIIMSPVAAGVGLTISGANNVIHLERHWNPAKEAQATDRVYRIGQTKEVNVYIPILHHPIHESFDVNLHQLLSRKTKLKDALVTPEEIMPNPEGFGSSSFTKNHRISPNDLHRLSWEQFESLSAELLSKKYFASNCWLTQNGADFGADIALTSGDSIKLIQCKHTKGNTYDGYKAITEVHGAKPKYAEALKKEISTLIFITNATTLSARTRETAKTYNVNIISFKELSTLLDNHTITFESIIRRLDKSRLRL